jgi:predicted Zn-dependent peptidase
MKALTSEPKQNGERRVTIEFDEKPTVFIGYHKPTLPAREDYVFDVIASILADGKNSRMYRSLVQDRKICANVDAGNGYPGAKYSNLFIVSGDPAEGVSTDEVEKALYAEIERLKTGVTAEEIARVATKIRADRIFKLDSNSSLAREINYFSTVAGSWRYEADYLEQVRTVTPDEIRKVIDQYLVPSNRTVGTLIPVKKGTKNEK